MATYNYLPIATINSCLFLHFDVKIHMFFSKSSNIIHRKCQGGSQTN